MTIKIEMVVAGPAASEIKDYAARTARKEYAVRAAIVEECQLYL